MRDPYGKGFPGAADPASNLVVISRDDFNDMNYACKGLRIENEKDEWITVKVRTVIDNVVELRIPPNCVWVEPLRIRRFYETGSDADVTVSAYVDFETGDEVKDDSEV